MTAADSHAEAADDLLGQAAMILGCQLDYRRTLPDHVPDPGEVALAAALAQTAQGYAALSAAAALAELADLADPTTASLADLARAVECAASAASTTTDPRGTS